MRRGPLIGLATLLLLLGTYSVLWWIVAGRIEQGIGDWADSLRGQKAELTWRSMRVGGFPFAFDARLTEARLRGTAAAQPSELHIPALSASARPWNFREWTLSAPDGLSGTIGPTAQPLTKLAAGSASGAASAGQNTVTKVWLRLNEM